MRNSVRAFLACTDSPCRAVGAVGPPLSLQRRQQQLRPSREGHGGDGDQTGIFFSRYFRLSCARAPCFGSKGARPTTPQPPWWQKSSRCWSSTCRTSASVSRWSKSWAGSLFLGKRPVGPVCSFCEVVALFESYSETFFSLSRGQSFFYFSFGWLVWNRI